MKYCWSHTDDINIMVPTSIVFSFLCFVALIVEASDSLRPVAYFLRIGSFAGIALFPLLFAAFVAARKYQLDEKGITIQYPFVSRVFYPWDVFSEIALCKIHYASASNAHILSIRCVAGKEKSGPKNAVVGKEKWARLEYGVIHYKTIISIYATNERIAEFHKVCPHQIMDYRHLEDRQ